MGLARVAVVLLCLIVVALTGAGRAGAAPVPAPSPTAPAPTVAAPTPTAPAADAACAAKAPGAVAWCMPWAIRLASPPAGARSHWVTQCSIAVSSADKQACRAASVTLDDPPRDGTASVLMDGPSDSGGVRALINCGLFSERSVQDADPAHKASWSTKQTQCFSAAAGWASAAYDPNPKAPGCSKVDVSCQVQKGAEEALSAGVRSGVQGLVDLAVQGMVFLLSKLAQLVFTTTSISAADNAFYSTYNSIAGVLVLLIFVFFIVSTIINGLRTSGGPGPLSTLGGLVRAVFGITFAGGIAFTIVAAWDQATNALIEQNARTPWNASVWTQAFTDLTGGVGTMLVVLVLSLLATIGLILLFIIMLFRGLLATGAALFGAMAMTGQVMPETRHWGRRWFWTVNALASSKFVIAGLWIYGSRSAYESDDLLTALKAVLLIWLMVVAPFILLRLTAIWDGYLSDVNAHGMLSVAGNPLELGADFAAGARDGAAGGGSSGGGGPSGGTDPVSSAAGLMNANSSAVPTTPGAALGEASGVKDGPGREAADAAATGEDGGRVGDPSGAADGATSESGDGTDGGGGSPNADEADGVKAGTSSAKHDVSAGELTAPGDATGAGGSVPATPQAAHGADPTGTGLSPKDPPGAGPGAGAGAEGSDSGTGAASSDASSPGALGGADSGAAGPGSSPGSADAPPDSPGAGGGHGPGEGDSEKPSGGGAAERGGGSATSGGSSSAAGAAAEVPPIV